MAYRKPAAQQREEAQARRDGILKDLADGIDRLTSSAEWKRYLDVQARFHHYSFANTMLIVMQCPTATRVASFKKWQELGRQVRKGEHGIRVWAPSTRRVETEAIRTEGPDGKVEKAEVVAGFRLVPVFDISQTEGEPLPEPVKLLQGEDEAGIFGKLTKVAETFGYSVQVTPEIDGHPGANGLCEYGPKRLTVAGNRSPLQQVKSLTHEIGHALLHEKTDAAHAYGTARGRALCELEAESTAYVVGRSLGLDTSDYSFGYVANWQGGDADKARESIKASGKAISYASRKILDTLQGELAEPEGEPEPVAEPQREAEAEAA